MWIWECVSRKCVTPSLSLTLTFSLSLSLVPFTNLFLLMWATPKRYLAQFNQRQMPLKHSYSTKLSVKQKRFSLRLIQMAQMVTFTLKIQTFLILNIAFADWLSINSTIRISLNKSKMQNIRSAFSHSKLNILHRLSVNVFVSVCVCFFLFLSPLDRYILLNFGLIDYWLSTKTLNNFQSVFKFCWSVHCHLNGKRINNTHFTDCWINLDCEEEWTF